MELQKYYQNLTKFSQKGPNFIPDLDMKFKIIPILANEWNTS